MRTLIIIAALSVLSTSTILSQQTQLSGEVKSKSLLPASMTVPSNMNNSYNQLSISQYAEDLLSEGKQVSLIIKYSAAIESPIALLSSADNNTRQSILSNYANDMAFQAQPIVNKLIGMDGVHMIKTSKYTPHIIVSSTMSGLEEMLASNQVVSIMENAVLETQTDVTNTIVGADILKGLGYNGSGTSIAIIDTGVDPNHEIFSGGKIIGSACFNFTNPNGSSFTTCPNGMDTQIDLAGGVAGTPCPIPPASPDNPMCGRHGNNVAGIAAGNPGSSNTEGIASGAGIVAINTFSFFPDVDGMGNPALLTYFSDVLLGLEWSLDHASRYNLAAVNMSLGGGRVFVPCDFGFLKPIIDILRSVGVATVIASGNDGFNDSVAFPACIESAITVGATDDSDNLAAFSNHREDLVDLLAPGVLVNSAYGYRASDGANFYASFTGTSMAAPHVAGAFAILKSKFPRATVTDIEIALEGTGTSIADPTTGEAAPRIQIDVAMNRLEDIITERYVIPTLGEWGAFILLITLASFSLVAIKARKSVLI